MGEKDRFVGIHIVESNWLIILPLIDRQTILIL